MILMLKRYTNYYFQESYRFYYEKPNNFKSLESKETKGLKQDRQNGLRSPMPERGASLF